MAAMPEQEFIDLHSGMWRELEAETTYFSRHMSRLRNRLKASALTRERVDHYIELYNQTANHLAFCRTFYGDTQTSEYLNRIAGNAHAVIYSKTVFDPMKIIRFFTTGFPKLFRKEFVMFLIAFLAMAISAAVAYAYVRADTRNALAFMDEQSLASIREEGNYDDYSSVTSSITGTYIGMNNIFVCLLAFAGGFTLGIYTLYMLISTGIQLGVLGAYTASKGQSAFFWSLILPHGVTELFAIFLSGAAGFMIARAIIMPGKLTRKTALVENGKKALKFMVMAAVFLIPSAIIESFFTPLDLPYYVKFMFASGVFALLVMYLCVGIRADIKEIKAGRKQK